LNPASLHQPPGDAIRREKLTVKKKALQKILDKVHHLFDYEHDSVQFGGEYWMDKAEIAEALKSGRGEFKGDCDDFVLACRMLCREQNIPSRLVFCKIDSEEYHLVLEVNGYILNNIHKWVMRQDDLDWEWISMSGFEPGGWTKVKEMTEE
jgi:predicted transglutaminase-like cysteine proteinase